MPCQMGNRMVMVQLLAKLAQLCVLSFFKWLTFQAFKFYANRVVIALASAPVMGLACVPSAVVNADKLPQGAIASDVKVR